jgi:hypothetical protein
VIGETIDGNQVDGNGTANSYGNGIGVQVGRNWKLGPTQAVIRNNDVRGNGIDGIRLGTPSYGPLGTPGGFVSGNTVANNVSVGNGTNTAVDTFEIGITAFDLHDLAPNCGTNVWSNNQWGDAGFTPACTSTGGSVVSGTANSSEVPRAAAPNAMGPTATASDFKQWENFLENGRHTS